MRMCRRQQARCAALYSNLGLWLVCMCYVPAQVFEYLTTDLKKYMDRSGKGPNFPLPKTTIKVGCCEQQHWRCAGHTCVCWAAAELGTRQQHHIPNFYPASVAAAPRATKCGAVC